MTAVTQGYISPVSLDPNETFFSGLGNIEKSNDHMPRACGKSEGRGLQPSMDTQQQQRSNEYSRGGMGDDLSSFFDFEPQTNPDSYFPPQYSSTITPTMGNKWNNMPFETLSPPDSAIFGPEEWPTYQFQPRPPQNIVTNVYPNDTRMQYGQTTPPDDDDTSIFEYEQQEQEQQQQQQQQPQSALSSSVVGAKKRKRTTASMSEPILPPKRSRKNAARSHPMDAINPQTDSNQPDDMRRSKFLERNRVAASKCRQKKKEWTSNLETRARDLQKNNSSFRMMLGSLKDEILFLKSEMLKHTSCGCDQIQSLLKQRAGDFAEQHEAVVKKEQSAIGTAPNSRLGSFNSGSHHGTVDGPTSPMTQNSPPSTPPEDHSLEALLTSQFVHDTSDQGIAQQVQAAE